jgi:hypothetical protein
MSKSPPINPEVVSLSEAIGHPSFSPTLRDLILAMAASPNDVSLAEVVAILGLDPIVIAQRFVAEAVGEEVLRCRAADAEKRGRLN